MEQLPGEIKDSPLYSEELAPVQAGQRTWNTRHLAALWVGMAVCIPTWVLASYMLKAGLNWVEALCIIGLANLVITLPMVLNGFAGVKYGLSFPVLGRSAFGIHGIHLASLLRGLVACGWFGVQTWIGGLAISVILGLIFGIPYKEGVNFMNFVGFGLFWLISLGFILKGFEGIKWLEEYAAPLLILVGVALIGWGVYAGGGFGPVLDKSGQLQYTSAVREIADNRERIVLQPLERPGTDETKATHAELWTAAEPEPQRFSLSETRELIPGDYFRTGANNFVEEPILLRFLQLDESGNVRHQSVHDVTLSPPVESSGGSRVLQYILWFTAMVGFWATMAISISDITRYATSQRAQIMGQFLGLPATMMLFSFVGLFVTSAAIVVFEDILIQEDAPWDPVSLLAHFENPWVVVGTQIIMLLATLSTNLAANVIAPATAFSNLWPKGISFKRGGVITGLVGIAICPWWLLDEISGILITVSAFLGPVLGILLCDYFLVRRGKLDVAGLFQLNGPYAYGGSGINWKAMIALIAGVVLALLGLWLPAFELLYKLAWFTGFATSGILYLLLMRGDKSTVLT